MGFKEPSARAGRFDVVCLVGVPLGKTGAAGPEGVPRLVVLAGVDLRRGETVALLKFTSGVQEVFAVAMLPRRFPDRINDDEQLLESSFVVPTGAGGRSTECG